MYRHTKSLLHLPKCKSIKWVYNSGFFCSNLYFFTLKSSSSYPSNVCVHDISSVWVLQNVRISLIDGIQGHAYSYLFSVRILSSKDGEFPRAFSVGSPESPVARNFDQVQCRGLWRARHPQQKVETWFVTEHPHSIFILSMGWSKKCSYIIASNTVAWQIYFQSTTTLFRPIM